MVSIKTEKRELDHIRLPLRLFARCVVGQLKAETIQMRVLVHRSLPHLEANSVAGR